MNKRAKINIALLALIAIAATVLWLTRGTQSAGPQETVSGIDRQAISTISVIRKGRAELKFGKQNNIWRMLAPRTARANTTRINAMLSVLQAVSYAQLDAGAMGLGRFDLLDPAVILKLDGYEFRFGGTNPLEGRRYLLFRDTIYLIDDDLFEQLQQPAAFFIRQQGN